MKNTNYFMICLFIIVNNILYSQNFTIKVSQYYSTYNLTDLKSFQKNYTMQLGSSLNIPFKVVDHFPSYYSYQIATGLKYSENLESGIIYNYSSSAARSDYQDYSGNLRLDFLLSSNSYGVYSEYSFPLITFLEGVFGTKILYNKSLLTFNNELTIFNESDIDKISFESNSFSFNPYGSIGSFYRWLFLRINFEYMIDFNGELTNTKGKKYKLPGKNNSAAKTNWSGFRIGLDIGLRF
jgi:hypothetical protein